MIWVILKGGIGNQMFQYAFGKYLSILFGLELSLDKGKYLSGNTNRLYDLDIFKAISVNVGNLSVIRKPDTPSPIFMLERTFSFDKKLVDFLESIPHSDDDSDQTIIVEGYWQSYKYLLPIENIIRNDFKIKISFEGHFAILEKQILACESVMINVRRGDYLNKLDYHGVVDISYLERAIDLMKKKLTVPYFFIFSDDINWCRQNLGTTKDIIFVDESYYDEKYKSYFVLMKTCRHFILSNSSFCWWAAWLSSNEKKIVVVPERWFVTDTISDVDLIPPTWTRL